MRREWWPAFHGVYEQVSGGTRVSRGPISAMAGQCDGQQENEDHESGCSRCHSLLRELKFLINLYRRARIRPGTRSPSSSQLLSSPALFMLAKEHIPPPEPAGLGGSAESAVGVSEGAEGPFEESLRAGVSSISSGTSNGLSPAVLPGWTAESAGGVVEDAGGSFEESLGAGVSSTSSGTVDGLSPAALSGVTDPGG